MHKTILYHLPAKQWWIPPLKWYLKPIRTSMTSDCLRTEYNSLSYMPSPWKCSRPDWMELWATWSSGRSPCSWQGTWD